MMFLRKLENVLSPSSGKELDAHLLLAALPTELYVSSSMLLDGNAVCVHETEASCEQRWRHADKLRLLLGRTVSARHATARVA